MTKDRVGIVISRDDMLSFLGRLSQSSDPNTRSAARQLRDKIEVSDKTGYSASAATVTNPGRTSKS